MDAQKVAEDLLVSLQNEGYAPKIATKVDDVDIYNTTAASVPNEPPRFSYLPPEIHVPVPVPSFDFAMGATTEAEMLRPELLRLADTNLDQNRALMQSAANIRAEMERREV